MASAAVEERSSLALCLSKAIFLLVVLGMLLHGQVQPISEMVHMAWSAEDGAPPGIQSMTQTPDGLLWISALGGLNTFDGVNFARFPATEDSRRFFGQNFHYLFASRSGDLWMFGFHGAPGRLHNGQFKLFDRVEWPYIEEFKFPQQESDGRLWAILNERQLVWLTQDDIWRSAMCPGHGSGHITAFYIDSSDTAWIVVDDRLYRRSRKSQEFELAANYVYGNATVKEGLQKDLWISSAGSTKDSKHPARHLQHLDHNGQELTGPDIGEPLLDVLPTPDGALWLLTQDNFLLHLTRDQWDAKLLNRIRKFPDQIQLTVGAEASGSRAFFRGLDGSVWVGGLGGLEEFTNSTLVPAIPGAPIGIWRSCVDSAGTLWINDPHEALYRRDRGANIQLVDKGVAGLFCSADGTVTLRDQRGLAMLRDGRVYPLPPIPGLERLTNHYMITGSAQTRDGRILAAVSGRVIGRSLWEFRDGKWASYLVKQEMPEVTAIYSDRGGRILLGFRGSDAVGVVDGTRLRNLETGKPGIRSTMGFAETSYGLFAYGLDGIAIDRGTYFHMLPFANQQHATTVMGLVESRDGDIWIASSAGVVRIAQREIRHGLEDSHYRLVSNDIREGTIAGPSIPELFSSKAHIDPSGRLWFTTLSGIVSVDPTAVKPSPPPLLSIRGIHADSNRMSVDATFPPNIRVLTIDYIGVDFKNPRRVSYRYKLDGYDTAWQNAGARTEAIYTYVSPGQYKFEVMAENAYGVWTAPVISAPFTVLPRFYQRLWFQLFCAFLLVVLLGLIIRARLKFVEAAIRERAEERADERISIARDLHDTLLQGVQGLLLTFHTAAERVPEGHESKNALEKALATADKIILEGRDRVKGLRSQNVTGNELCSALEALGDDLNSFERTDYSVSCLESENTLAPHVASEIFLIAREAIVNAFRHGEATRISVSVRHGRRDFTLQCDDNGKGFDFQAPHAQKGHGHWGIRGMSERADKLKATLHIRSIPGQGTSVHIALRAKRAYES